MDTIKLTIEEAAETLKVSETEVKLMMKNGNLDVADDDDGLPGVCEKSVYEFMGEVWVAPVAKKRGRQPTVISLEEAMEMLDAEDTNAIKHLINTDDLEAWILKSTGEVGVTYRSVKEYKRKIASTETDTIEDHSKSIEAPYEHNDNFDMSEERELNEDVSDISVGETGESMVEVDEIIHSIADTIEEEPLVSSTDFTGMPDVVQEEYTKEVTEEENDIIPLNEDEKYLKAKEDKERLKAMAEKPATNEDMISMKKDDFNAYLSIASMRAEIQVYRSLKSFERR